MEVTDDLKLTEGLKKGHRVAALVGYFMAGSVLLYAVAVELVSDTLAPFEGMAPELDINTLRYVFVGVSVAMFFLAKVVRNLIVAAGVAGPTDDAGKAEALADVAGFIKTLSGKAPTSEELVWKSRFQSYVQRLYFASIVTYFFCEVIAICGLVLFFIGGKSADFYVFMLFSLVGFAVYIPRYAQWEEWMRSRGGAHSGPTGP